jgi:hypothetical protein
VILELSRAWSNFTNYPYIFCALRGGSPMKSFSKFTMCFASLAVFAGVTFASPALAQDAFGSGSQDQMNSMGATGERSNTNYTTGTQTQQVANGNSPTLQGATNGTISPQGAEATVVQGVNTAGTVRVNNLANLEALLNIIANGMEILGIAWGGPTMIMGFMHMAAGSHDAMKKVLFGAAGVTGGLATPGCINWLVASARDAALFN